ncbi:hypothetical protein BHM03_00019327 [Ensete ventricosum]|nr:hypothetical protein BHM03_00019327 [Ensete ventricosum]
MGGKLLKDGSKQKVESTEEEEEEEEEEGEAVDWSNIQVDMLELIADRLAVDIFDHTRFSVCKEWNSSIPRDRAYSPRLPWLLLRHDEDLNRLFFYSLSSARVHSIKLPATSGENITGSFDGWLVLENQFRWTMSFLNPLTGVHIHLPMLPTHLRNNREHRHPSIWKIATSSNSSTSYNNCTIIVIPVQFSLLLSFRLGEDDNWTKLDDTRIYTDVIYFKERFHVTHSYARVSIFDSHLRKVMVISPRGDLGCGTSRFAELSGELIVFRSKYIKNSINQLQFDLKKMEIFKLNRGLMMML